MVKTKIILDYIEQFQKFGPQVVDCFSNGMCYHFSLILCTRFPGEARRVYDPINNHFATQIDCRIYDITGDITDNLDYKWVYWDEYAFEDPLHTEHIRRDCMWKVPTDTVICEFCGYAWMDEWGTLICDKDKKPTWPNYFCGRGKNK